MVGLGGGEQMCFPEVVFARRRGLQGVGQGRDGRWGGALRRDLAAMLEGGNAEGCADACAEVTMVGRDTFVWTLLDELASRGDLQSLSGELHDALVGKNGGLWRSWRKSATF